MSSSHARSRPAGTMSGDGLGILAMLLAMLLFAANDTMGKWLVSTYGVGQIMFLRSVGALLVIAPFLTRLPPGALWRVERPWLLTLRCFFGAFEASAFYYATITLPLADVITYWLAAPIYVAALSPWLLKEKVGWRRWTAIAVGFIGVAVALRPSSAALTPAAVVSLVGSFVFSLTVVYGRQLRGTPDIVLVFWQFVAALLCGLATVPFFWVPPSTRDFGLLALLGIVSMVGHVCVTRSLKLGSAATVAPMQYSTLLWGVIFGWIFFGEVPDAMLLVGAAIIIASGLFIAFRERKMKVDGEPTVVDSP